MALLPKNFLLDIVGGKCCVFQTKFGKPEEVFSSDKAFEALNYVLFMGYKTFYISDMADLWLELESHEYCAEAMRERQYLFNKCA